MMFQSNMQLYFDANFCKDRDRFLIMDVANYKYPLTWAKAEVLWVAMNTLDSESKRSRGFVLITVKGEAAR